MLKFIVPKSGCTVNLTLVRVKGSAEIAHVEEPGDYRWMIRPRRGTETSIARSGHISWQQ
jgi:hypothetical protein